MSQDKIDILQRALLREKAARKQAEKILEEKSSDLYYANKRLEKLYKEVESELTRTDSQLQGVFENIVDAYVIMDLFGNILKMNSAAVNLLGFESEKTEFNLMNMIFPEDAENITNSFKSLLKNGFITDLEIKIKTKLNELKVVHINASIIYDKGVPVAAQGIVRDITKLREEELVVELINNIAQAILGKLNIYEIAYEITDKIAKFLKSEDCVIYLYHEDEQTLEQIAAYGEKLNENKQLINKIFLNSGEGIVGYIAKSAKGEIIKNTSLDKRYVVDLVESKSEITVPIVLGNKVIGIIDSENDKENFFTKAHFDILTRIANMVALQLQSAIDIRERNIAEEQLKQSEERLSTLILNLDRGVLLVDENNKVIVANNKYCEFFQFSESPDQLAGQDCTNFPEQRKFLFKDPEVFVKDIEIILKNQKEVLGEELTMVNGQIFERDYIPIYRNNKYKGHLWSYKDFTLRRKYRQSIEAQRLKYRSIITNMNLGLVEVNNDDKILMVNKSFCEMSGYSEKELLGQVAGDIFIKDIDKSIVINQNLKRQKGESNSYDLIIRNKAGEARYWLISGAPNYNLNGEVIGSIGIHLDITDLKNLQVQKEILLKDLEKSNDELHEYAHVVSHDLKSPLRSINALVSWLKEDNIGKFDETSLQNFGLIESTVEKMEQLISNILNYSSLGADSVQKEMVNLNNLVSEQKDILYFPKHISLTIKSKLPTLFGDNTKLQQLFQNLISNAIKFCDKEKGIIEVDYIELESHYQFSVKDNGMGIEEKYHEKIFKIFNYLNKSKDSSGIGLSIVKKIVALHEGAIWLESELGKGTTFYFTIKK
jgi:PAS domain S-box-containing protein